LTHGELLDFDSLVFLSLLVKSPVVVYLSLSIIFVDGTFSDVMEMAFIFLVLDFEIVVINRRSQVSKHVQMHISSTKIINLIFLLSCKHLKLKLLNLLLDIVRLLVVLIYHEDTLVFTVPAQA